MRPNVDHPCKILNGLGASNLQCFHKSLVIILTIPGELRVERCEARTCAALGAYIHMVVQQQLDGGRIGPV